MDWLELKTVLAGIIVWRVKTKKAQCMKGCTHSQHEGQA